VLRLVCFALAFALHVPTHAQDTGGPNGTLLVPRGSALMTLDARTGEARPIPIEPSPGVIGHAVWSPDGTRAAFSRFARPPGERIGGSDILVVGAAGGTAQTVAHHDRDGVLLGAPAWLPDASGVLYEQLPPNGASADTLVVHASWIPPLAPRPIAFGSWPTASPDGRFIAYVRPSWSTGDVNELVVVERSSGAERVLVGQDQFIQIASPRFSPDGHEVAFIGSLTRDPIHEVASLDPVIGMAVARHGPPGDIWIIGVDGHNLTRRTGFDEDEPTLAWSPDGAWLAMFAGGGLYLVPRIGVGGARRVATGGFGGIDWR
jgi:Tol biopolymer transport system component